MTKQELTQMIWWTLLFLAVLAALFMLAGVPVEPPGPMG